MKPDAQRRAIAEACGWKPSTDGGICWDARGRAIISPPEYLNDLNAMHEAEKTLGEKADAAWGLYVKELLKACDTSWYFIAIHATAAQRAEAFLRVIGKWTP